MAFTSHGHHVPGTVLGFEPELRARCGGTGLCSVCRAEALRHLEYRNLFLDKPEGVDLNLFESKSKLSEREPTEIARLLVVDEFNENLNRADLGKEIEYSDTYFYFFAYILGGWKCYVSTTVPDNKIYEVTYNSARKEAYVDVYVKLNNRKVEIK